MVDRISWSCWGPKLNPQSLRQGAHNHLQLQLQGTWHLLLDSAGNWTPVQTHTYANTCAHTCARTHMHTCTRQQTSLKIWKCIFFLLLLQCQGPNREPQTRQTSVLPLSDSPSSGFTIFCHWRHTRSSFHSDWFVWPWYVLSLFSSVWCDSSAIVLFQRDSQGSPGKTEDSLKSYPEENILRGHEREEVWGVPKQVSLSAAPLWKNEGAPEAGVCLQVAAALRHMENGVRGGRRLTTNNFLWTWRIIAQALPGQESGQAGWVTMSGHLIKWHYVTGGWSARTQEVDFW